MECSICFSALDIEGTKMKLGCGHEYHTTCINTWLDKSCTCPLCRCVVSRVTAPTRVNNVVTDQMPMSVVLATVYRLLREYANADDIGEKNYKKNILYDLIRRHHLNYDNRVCIALAEHNLPMM